MFIGCVIAGVSGIISKIAVNLTPILERWTSVDFLGIGESDLGGTENSAIYVDTCVSGNGDLSIPLGIIEERIVKINQYVNNFFLLTIDFYINPIFTFNPVVILGIFFFSG